MTRFRRAVGAWVAAMTLLVLAACGPADPTTAGATGPLATGPLPAGTSGQVPLDGRPFALTVPAGYDAGTPVPLVVGLHGYTSSGAELASYLGLTAQSQDRGFLLATPDGTPDADGKPFWNATTACCDFHDTGVDDSAYLAHLITTVEAQYAVDPARVYVVGHSNGGFMALRMACEHADLVTAVVSVAGEMTDDVSSCTPARPVSVLQVQGDADETIRYRGGSNGPGRRYPGAEQTVADWAGLDGCAAAPQEGPALDLEDTVSGAETTPLTWSPCEAGTEVALWTIAGGRHVPAWSPTFGPALADWLLAHAR
ncbi:alpha/beta fold hydrolase [Xylanimonas allomyrinae]|uniref:Alpha/beta fold hydrolase n=1 Tax=Xylanimonas allomyrinae TaxID=2509459 RepID=A0A4P6ETQ5_9MICO|nr:alpha/beta fold hydrolase [Xylanimonas allomyrinae]QAY63767.1 alpha/beta fold hydrolase [Xylanimonas allomyrinae]